MIIQHLAAAGQYSDRVRVNEITHSFSMIITQMLEASDGSIYLFGDYQDDERYGFDRKIVIIKLDADWNQVWAKRFSSGPTSFAGAVLDSSENIVLAMGYTDASGNAIYAYTVKVTSAGAISWQQYQHVGATAVTSPRAIAIDGSNNVYTLTLTNREGAGGYDFLLTKYNSSGTLQWDYTLGLTGDQYPEAIVVDNAGAIIVAGNNSGSTELYVAKYTSAGAVTWQKKITPDANQIGLTNTKRELAVDSSDRIYIGRNASTGHLGGFIRLTSAGALDISPETSLTTSSIDGGVIIPISGDRILQMGSGQSTFDGLIEWDVVTEEVFWFKKIPDSAYSRDCIRRADGSILILNSWLNKTSLLEIKPNLYLANTISATPNATEYTLQSYPVSSFTIADDPVTVANGTLTNTAAVMTTVAGALTLTNFSPTIYPPKSLRV